MTIIESHFKEIDNLIKSNKELEDLLKYLEKNFKDNKELMQYIKVTKKLNKNNDKLSKYKDLLYEDMLNENINTLDGKYCQVNLKRPYYRTQFKLKEFLENVKPSNPIYKKYVEQNLIKGNIRLKILEEDK